MTVVHTFRTAIRNVPVPPGQVVGIAVAMALGRLFPVVLPGRRVVHVVAGGALTGAGTALIVWALRERARHARSFDLERPETLVTTGPYAYSRHPMYVGWWLLHLGVGVLGGSAWVLLSVPAAAVAEHPAVLAEECRLQGTFGAEADRYAAHVPRYLPTLARRWILGA
jgi:protein-S-isoprenylcysteine O-methyltransferase Ste14